MVRIKKYKITIEEIEESEEVLQKRLQELWETSKHNYHQFSPMKHEAEKLNYELKGSMGEKYQR